MEDWCWERASFPSPASGASRCFSSQGCPASPVEPKIPRDWAAAGTRRPQQHSLSRASTVLWDAPGLRVSQLLISQPLCLNLHFLPQTRSHKAHLWAAICLPEKPPALQPRTRPCRRFPSINGKLPVLLSLLLILYLVPHAALTAIQLYLGSHCILRALVLCGFGNKGSDVVTAGRRTRF